LICATTLNLTAGFAIATFADNGKTAEQLIECADQALVEAKNSGRNRTVVKSGNNQDSWVA